MNHMSQKNARFNWHRQYSRNIHLGVIITLVILSLAFYSIPRLYTAEKIIPLPAKVIVIIPPNTDEVKRYVEPVRPSIPIQSEKDDVPVDELFQNYIFNPEDPILTKAPESESENVDAIFEPWMLKREPKPLKKVTPKYPEFARRIAVTGEVVCLIVVGKDGRVESAEIIKSIEMLDDAVLTAVRQWIFTPGLQRDNPVRVKMKVPFKFALKD